MKRVNILLTTLFAAVIIVGFLLPDVLARQDGLTVQEALSGGKGIITKQIGNFYAWAVGISALVALGILVYAGLSYTVAGGNASRQSDAKQWIWNALIGLALLFGSYIILNTINPDLVGAPRFQKEEVVPISEGPQNFQEPVETEEVSEPQNTVLISIEDLEVKREVGRTLASVEPTGSKPRTFAVACPVGQGPKGGESSWSKESFCSQHGSGRYEEFRSTCIAVCGSKGDNCHGGLDIFNDFRTPVYAVEDGVIAERWGLLAGRSGYRLHLIGDYSGIDYYYAHLVSNPLVPPGRKVKVGQLLGYLDHTGNAAGTPDHLHLEITKEGTILNPLALINRVCGGQPAGEQL